MWLFKMVSVKSQLDTWTSECVNTIDLVAYRAERCNRIMTEEEKKLLCVGDTFTVDDFTEWYKHRIERYHNLKKNKCWKPSNRLLYVTNLRRFDTIFKTLQTQNKRYFADKDMAVRCFEIANAHYKKQSFHPLISTREDDDGFTIVDVLI